MSPYFSRTCTFFVLLFVIVGIAANAKTGDEPNLTGIVSGSNVIHVSCEGNAKENTTVVTFTTYDSDFKFVGKTDVTVKSIDAKICVPKAFYSPYSSNEIIGFELTMKEKLFSKSVTFVRLSPDYKIQYQYIADYDGQGYMKFNDEAYFSQQSIDCMPQDHLMYSTNTAGSSYAEQDGWSDAGGLLYLRHKINDEGYRSLEMKYDSKVNTALYYYLPSEGKINKMWKIDIDEERILGYKVCCFGDTGFLFTSYLTGNDQKKNGETFESRVRKFKIKTGEIIWNVTLPVQNGFEYFYTAMTYDRKSKNAFFSFNCLATEWHINNKGNDGTQTKFVVVQVSESGKCISNEQVLTWTVTESTYRTDEPIYLVKHMAILKDGHLQLSGMFSYWLADIGGDVQKSQSTATGNVVTATTLSIAFTGFQNMIFTPELKLNSSKQLPFDSFGGNSPSIGVTGCLSPRTWIAGCPSIDSKIGVEYYWNPVTETMILLATNPHYKAMSKDRQIVACKTIAGKETSCSSYGTTELSQGYMMMYALVLTDKVAFYNLNYADVKNYKRIEIN